MAAAADADWAVAVFAHNEEASVGACLDSLHAAADGHRFRAFVLINGCGDATQAIVEDRARRDPAIHPVLIALGDKSNAWNLYVHEVVPQAAVYFFVDGDVRIRPASFRRLHEALSAHPRARAACGIPMSGRSRHELAEHILAGRGFHGSLYALRGTTVAAFRAARLRLPTGLIGDDSLLGWLLRRDLDPRGAADRNRIIADAAAGFEFNSLSPWQPRDWRLYYHRLWRNSLRQMQLNLLIPMLRQRGPAAMPARIADLYTPERLARLRPRWSGLMGWFDLLALHHMRGEMVQHQHHVT